MTSVCEELPDESMPDRKPPDDPLAANGRVPEHVVYREFVNETVVLNLQTGTYHGLNRTAGRMLDAVERTTSLREAAAQVAGEHGWDLATVEEDLVGLCQTLAERGLLEFSEDKTS
jgi:hypothetical protein